MDIVLGKVKKVRKWSNESLVEGLQTRFACGSGYNKIRQLPYVALPSYTCLLRKIESVHFDTGKSAVKSSQVMCFIIRLKFTSIHRGIARSL